MSAPTIDEQIACVLREIRMRESVYPRWIAAGKMTAEKSAHEIEVGDPPAVQIEAQEAAR